MKLLATYIHDLTKEHSRRQVVELLGYLYGTILKGYDDEEQLDCIIDNCNEWKNNPDCFNSNN